MVANLLYMSLLISFVSSRICHRALDWRLRSMMVSWSKSAMVSGTSIRGDDVVDVGWFVGCLGS